MPRTLNAQSHQIRRDAFLDAAQTLIQARGYEQMTIQDLLDALGASRGALYHYFDSKQALLDGVVERFADAGMATIAPILDDPQLPALTKLEQVVRGIAQFKADQRELVVAIIEVWNSDGNALVREKLRRMTAERLGPLLTAVISQGVAEGTLEAEAPEETARIVTALILGYQPLAVEQFIGRQNGTVTIEEVRRTYAALTRAIERILGVPANAITLMDDDTLLFWFG